MSKIAIIGASGFVGTQLTKEALSRGYDVTAIVRHPEKITLRDPRLSVVKGDVLDEEQVAALVKGHDAVLSAYNAGWENPRLYEDFIRASRAIQEGTRQAGVTRLLVVGGAGSLEIAPGVQLVDTPEFPEAWKSGAQAARDYLNMLKEETRLEWTFISPAILLQPGERTGKYRVGKDNPVFDEQKESRISVEDLAVALLDALDQHLYIRERFTVAY
jgi:putative NADH-flavin reductase